MNIKSIAFAALLGLATAAQPALAETKLMFNVFFPASHPAWPVFKDWAKDIHDATGGDILIEFPAQSVAPPDRVLESVRTSMVDAGFIYNGFLADKAPGTMVSQMPWMHRGDSEAISVALWNTYQDFYAGKNELRGVELVSMFHLGPTWLCTVVDKPLNTLEDLRQLRIWALPGTIADIYSGLDMAIVAGPAVQIHELVSRNTVDAYQGLTMETTVNFKAAPYTKACYEMERSLQSANFSVFFNKRTWDRLPAEHREAIMAHSGAKFAAAMGRAVNAADSAARQQLIEQGVEFKPTSAEIQQALEGAAKAVEAAWVEKVAKAGIDGKAMLQQLDAATAKAAQK
ncbi:TRAP transporter substrate-binding protein DctP [Marinobacterium aestuariivivens]|uniref:TRAP transporter substrate-binding protein DctP n=1 Tax=Marinobacterium aestuariivivens TaxID=1698799 RepID=A0ABW2A9Z7_9GAMM